MRLIDLDNVYESWLWSMVNDVQAKEPLEDRIINYLEEQQVVYDVDKVIDQLEQLFVFDEKTFTGDSFIEKYKEMIEIVRKGGVDG